MSASAAVFGSIVAIFLIIAASVSFLFWKRRFIHRNTILEADLSRNHEEHLPEDRLGRLLTRGAPLLLDLVEALRMASEDRKVTLLVARVGGSGMKMAKVQEIRDAVIRFRAKGKKAIAYAESFGEFGAGNTPYYLATAFDKVYIQPSGTIGLTGLGMKTPFLSGLLEKIGIEPQIGFRKEYKSAAYTLTEREYTQPHREADQAVLESLLSQMIEGISQSRGISHEGVRSLIESGPFSAKRALREKLVDGLAYRDEVYAASKKEAGKGSRLLSLSGYLKKKGGVSRGKKRIALIYGIGRIAPGKSRYTAVGRFVMGSDTISAAFRSAAKDKKVRAIIFRIDSPGGSYVASDAIWRETICAKNAGKPVIASMGDVAGSGGYFVAMACDRIIAHPGTITGSIGVVSGKMVTSRLWNKVGIHWGTLFTNKNADFWSDTNSYSEEQWKLLNSWLDEIYQDFVRKAADGRKLDYESVNDVAKGRIWSGQDAMKRGLVDELGGLRDAIRAAKEAAKIKDDEQIGLRILPLRRSLLKRLFGARERGDGSVQALWYDLQGVLASDLRLHDEVLRARLPMIDL